MAIMKMPCAVGGGGIGDITALVPILTADNSSAECTAITNSTAGADYYAYKSFDADGYSSWNPNNNNATDEYLGVTFTSAHDIKLIDMALASMQQIRTFNFDIEVYDGSNWSKIDTWSLTPPLGTQSGTSFLNCPEYVKQINAKGVYGIRIFSAESLSVYGVYYIALPRLQFFGV